jgi:hypothetical protein
MRWRPPCIRGIVRVLQDRDPASWGPARCQRGGRDNNAIQLESPRRNCRSRDRGGVDHDPWPRVLRGL